MTGCLAFNRGVLTLLGLLLVAAVNAEVAEFQRLSTQDGLPDSSVRAITQDAQGFMWFGTTRGLVRYDGHRMRVYALPDRDDPTGPEPFIQVLLPDSRNGVWVGTRNRGLFHITAAGTRRYNALDGQLNSNTVTALHLDAAGWVWIGSEGGIERLQANGQRRALPPLPGDAGAVTGLLPLHDGEWLVGARRGLFLYSTAARRWHTLLPGDRPAHAINAIHRDARGQIWLGTDGGLQRWNRRDGLQQVPGVPHGRVMTLTSADSSLWAGLLFQGLHRVHLDDGHVSVYKYRRNSPHSLSGVSVMSVFLDRTAVLWTGMFHNGLNRLSTAALKFGLENAGEDSFYCAENQVFYSVNEIEGELWVSSNAGLIRYNPATRACRLYTQDRGQRSGLSHDSVQHVQAGSDGALWVSTMAGLNRLDPVSERIDTLRGAVPEAVTYFSVERDAEALYLGTQNGLYLYHHRARRSEAVPVRSEQLRDQRINATARAPDGGFIFATRRGLARINEHGELASLRSDVEQINAHEITALHVQDDGQMWVAVFNRGLYQLDAHARLIRKHGPADGIGGHITVNSILPDAAGHLWMGSDSGLIRYRPASRSAHTFHRADGLQNDYFLRASAHRSANGVLAFGGRQGLNRFDPQSIEINAAPPPVALTELSRFNQPVHAGAGGEFTLPEEINSLSSLQLGHRDYIIGFQFAALDFNDPARNRYAHRLEGLEEDWNFTDADNRRVTYTNLAPGHYTLLLKASNKDGVWSLQSKRLHITVLPAPWLSWWAFVLYALAAVLGLVWLIRHRTRSARQRSRQLQAQVEARTREVKMQKQTVESLLAHKNEVFANITHEFRTPLTLILGPLQTLLKKIRNPAHREQLQMMDVYANKLLHMIEQLLHLASLDEAAAPKRRIQAVAATLKLIGDSFVPLAQARGLKLSVHLDCESVHVCLTRDALDIVIGNLLSNAIKYTPAGGEVLLQARSEDGRLKIDIRDTGPGIPADRHALIFNRFTRLESTAGESGAGIGLSVVREVVQANEGTVQIDSTPGQGSCFTLTFNQVSVDDGAVAPAIEPADAPLSGELRSAPATPVAAVLQPLHSEDKDRERSTVLIIEDHEDMRRHVSELLSEQYHCVSAVDGAEGIAQALKVVPDIIVCDVMMPQMNGYQVCRVLRNDPRTSHIPIVLLTALNDRASRIKGWREHVDAFLSKPFDGDELLLRLHSTLTVRRIVARYNRLALRAGAAREGAQPGAEAALDLCKKDRQFVEKLHRVIERHHSDEGFLGQQMAAEMAVSQRQLQRKTKALLDENPMDMLKRYRLERAAELLREGHQVSHCADASGFASVSYFALCFRKQYGMTPKKFQQMNTAPDVRSRA